MGNTPISGRYVIRAIDRSKASLSLKVSPYSSPSTNGIFVEKIDEEVSRLYVYCSC